MQYNPDRKKKTCDACGDGSVNWNEKVVARNGIFGWKVKGET
jgi:hypothetical protein